ncbi:MULTISPECIES: type VI secretion system-associated FHA domain protein TagH [Roseomonadaceae]|uniref:Type VI secretion system-associated FHA domain protein TagH n=1 Tax=Falsiroseomonas oleicola TaxID=2801474 RepID=A0ABS6H571_9PROT|nr:type VI secretion system-associated FHA domain protein TagH [Roseomonas oleicola]MBU8543843.1 type VI secretion system-associated FHA domain protein TagH [Roseomonas oleicola]
MAEITLSVLRCPDAVAPGQRRAAGGEISLGRGADCDWPLQDPDRVLSKRHCVLEFYGGGWQVRDLSTNGTFVNHAEAPLGRDQVRPLLDGDRLRLGAYEIEVRIAEAAAPGASRGWGAASDPAADAPPSQGFGAASLPGFGASPPPTFGASSGVGLGGGMGGGMLPDDFDPFGQDPAPMPDHAPSTAEAFMVPPSLPVGKSQIPDDWDLDLTPRPAVPPAAPPLAPTPPAAAYPPPTPDPFGVPAPSFPPPAASYPLPTTPLSPPRDPFLEAGDPVPTPQAAPIPATPPPVAPAPMAAAGGLAALLAGAGLPPQPAAQDPDAALRAAGAVLRAAITGIRALLIARADVKREFRIEQTMLRAANNNPLKFAATEDQALATLLDPRTPALAAVRETVEDLTAHQVATLAATQAAARALLERLSPASIEAEDPGGGLLPGAREKRLWEAYRRRHALLAEQFEDDFDSAFGKAFARAYEQAMRGH